MNHNWTLLGQIESPGTVADLAGDPAGSCWLAAPAGLFEFNGARWIPHQRAVPFLQATAVGVAKRSVLAAGLPNGIIRSINNGTSWQSAWIDQTQTSITCLTSSPNVSKDHVWLAGTRGDGILRSTDGGRHWELSNWGLRDFTVLELVTAPTWEKREYAFAVTLEGVYQSPNGGRAWRLVSEGLQGERPQTCAFSPSFAIDQTVWVGTEAENLYRSENRGLAWEKLQNVPRQWRTINSMLAISEQILLVAAGLEGIWRSPNGGQDWEQTEYPQLKAGEQVLSLKHVGETLFACLLEGGLWSSADGGATWESHTGLTARRFLWLRALPDGFIAGGPEAGLWFLGLEEDVWECIVEPGGAPILALETWREKLLVSRPEGLYFGSPRSLDKPIFRPQAPLVRIWPVGERCWGLDQEGQLWFGDPGSEIWDPVPSPEGQRVMAISAGGPTGSPSQIFCTTYDSALRDVVLWSAGNGEGSWQQVMSAAAGEGLGEIAISQEGHCYISMGYKVVQQLTGQRHQAVAVSDPTAPLIAMTRSADAAVVVAASVKEMWHASQDGEWVSLEPLPAGETIADLIVQGPQEARTVLVLTSDGRLWRHALQ